MTKIIAIHSFRQGTGKSYIAANVAAMLALEGRRIALVDADLHGPGVQILLGLRRNDYPYTLNHYLFGECDIMQTTYDVTRDLGHEIAGSVFMLPASDDPSMITRVLRGRYEPKRLGEGLHRVIHELNLDAVVVDMTAGLNEQNMQLLALSEALALILRLDQQDYEGTGVLLRLARQVGVTRPLLIVNDIASVYEPDEVKRQVENTYNSEVVAVLPHTEELMLLGSDGVFALYNPHHPLAVQLRYVAIRLAGVRTVEG